MLQKLPALPDKSILKQWITHQYAMAASITWQINIKDNEFHTSTQRNWWDDGDNNDNDDNVDDDGRFFTYMKIKGLKISKLSTCFLFSSEWIQHSNVGLSWPCVLKEFQASEHWTDILLNQCLLSLLYHWETVFFFFFYFFLRIWKLTSTLTMKSAIQAFCILLWLMMMYHNTKFGCKMSNSSK